MCDVINKWCKLTIIILLPLKEVIKHNYYCDHSYSLKKKQLYTLRKAKNCFKYS